MTQPPLTCLACGEDRLIEIESSPSKAITLVLCQVCGKSSLHQWHNPATCRECGGVGSHEAGCQELGKV